MILKVIISLFETVKLSNLISPRYLYNSLKSIQEKLLTLLHSEMPKLQTFLAFLSEIGLMGRLCSWGSQVFPVLIAIHIGDKNEIDRVASPVSETTPTRFKTLYRSAPR